MFVEKPAQGGLVDFDHGLLVDEYCHCVKTESLAVELPSIGSTLKNEGCNEIEMWVEL